jgi:pSer/pThr/pTyr-binding forkhead associated (FHA) protein
MARLIITGGFGKPFRYEVEEGETVVGRETDVDLVLPNNSVSRKHAKLIRDGDELRVQDLGSRNGVQVNGERVESAILTAGDVLAIGRFQLTRVSPSESLFEGRYIEYLD